VAAPTIVLDKVRQTLVAWSNDAGEPVEVVLLSGLSGREPGTEKGTERSSPQRADQRAGTGAGQGLRQGAAARQTSPSVVRLKGGDLKYSDAERKATIKGGSLGLVTAATGTATSTSSEAELVLLPAGNHAGKDGGAARVERLTARGHVVVVSQGRRGTGEQLVYSSESGEYVLTGTPSTPPQMTDPARGNVTGEALIFSSSDDSVTIEGGGRKTTTETTAPK
jgi:lipopolysaccharide export system protein LptA